MCSSVGQATQRGHSLLVGVGELVQQLGQVLREAGSEQAQRPLLPVPDVADHGGELVGVEIRHRAAHLLGRLHGELADHGVQLRRELRGRGAHDGQVVAHGGGAGAHPVQVLGVGRCGLAGPAAEQRPGRGDRLDRGGEFPTAELQLAALPRHRREVDPA